jgi:hypothetical protein
MYPETAQMSRDTQGTRETQQSMTRGSMQGDKRGRITSHGNEPSIIGFLCSGFRGKIAVGCGGRGRVRPMLSRATGVGVIAALEGARRARDGDGDLWLAINGAMRCKRKFRRKERDERRQRGRALPHPRRMRSRMAKGVWRGGRRAPLGASRLSRGADDSLVFDDA